jgi:hypothetical protein
MKLRHKYNVRLDGIHFKSLEIKINKYKFHSFIINYNNFNQSKTENFVLYFLVTMNTSTNY